MTPITTAHAHGRLDAAACAATSLGADVFVAAVDGRAVLLGSGGT